MPLWETDIELDTEKGKVRLPVRLERGLFQGDSLSPLLFCLCIAALSHGLRKRAGFRSEFHDDPVTHLSFMDDLKVYAENEEQLEDTVQWVEEVSAAVGMQMGLKKCAVAHMKRGRVVTRGPLKLRNSQEVDKLASDETYAYLGVEQLLQTKAEKTKRRIRKKYMHRLHRVWGSDLAAGAKTMPGSWRYAPISTPHYGSSIAWSMPVQRL